eukprot:541494-Amphidinium_carterae.1
MCWPYHSLAGFLSLDGVFAKYDLCCRAFQVCMKRHANIRHDIPGLFENYASGGNKIFPTQVKCNIPS